ncbi:MAG: 1-acyl-sn-glycerol-3-phosphate acyltransferase [Cyanobacteria bacterium P01_C01_bin.121]
MAADSSLSSPATGVPTGKEAHQGPTFFPPKQNPLMTRLVQSISYPLGRILYKVRLSVSDEAVSKVRSVGNARVVYVCNHPTMEDGITLFMLSARLGQLFHYVVAYEAFKGWLGWFIQRLGCYSIRRGLGDRTSISQSLTILKQPRCRLVIFPEGGCSYQNDTIMPFRSGAIQLPMSVLAQLAKKADSPETIPNVYVVPLVLKYRYRQSMEQVIEDTMHRLEAALGIVPDDLDNYQRLRRIANQVILKIEDEANLDDDGTLDWNQRIERLRQVFVKKCESAFELEPSENLPVRERVYKVQALLEDLDLIDSPDGTDVTTVLGPNQLNPQDVYWDTIRLLNFDAIYDGYVAEAPTPERFLDTLMRIEREVFHLVNAQPKAPRQACVEVCEPINLKDYLSDYRRERSSTVDRLASELHQIMQTTLENMNDIAIGS